MDERDKKTELLVGLFLFVGLVLLGLLILQFGSLRELFKGTYDLRVSFSDASGLKEGSPVMLGGARIGKVKARPEHDDTFTRLILELEIFAGVQIPATARFAVGTSGLMGDAFVDVKPDGKITDQFLVPDATKIIQGEKGADIADLSKTAGRIGEQVTVLLEEDVRPFMAQAKQAMEKVNEGALSPESVEHFKSALARFESIMRRVDEKVVSEENIANLTGAIAEVKSAATSFNNTAKNFETQSARLGPLLDRLDPAIAKVEKSLDSADAALQSAKKGLEGFAKAMNMLGSGDGALQSLMTDKQLKNDLKEAIRAFKEFSENLEKTGIYRYKDLNSPGAAPESNTQPQRPSSPLSRPGR
jgi:phospholipid/cholesterol/gamma-HCH transport system substrate-binding protein